MKTLSLEHILQLHILAIRSFGGNEGIRDLGRLESAIASQDQEAFGKELYVGLHAKAAAMCRGIIGDHPFSDGNKRTAMLVALTFLQINGVEIEAQPGELEDFAVRIATDQLDVPVIARWLDDRSHSHSE
jgi:death-on-curing protein